MKLSDLNPNPKNPRKIADWQKDALKRSIEAFGDLSGFIYNRRSKQLEGGHQRKQVMPQDAEVTVEKKYPKPTRTGTVAEGYVVLAGERYAYREVDWDADTALAANIAANKHGGEFDDHLLKQALAQLDDELLELTGFHEDELDKLIEQAGGTEGLCDEDEVPEEVPAITKPGDLWILGEHRLLCGDCTVAENVQRLMAGEKADMVFTDPPYGVNERTMRKSAGRSKLAENHDLRPVWGDDSNDTAVKAFSLWIGTPGIWWGANYYSNNIPEVSSWLVWDKRDGVGSDDNADCELAWVWNKKPARVFRHLWKGCIRASEKTESKVHPTQKPVVLAEWCFENYGNPKLIWDGFLGSGSTLIACEKTNRKCYGMEIDPHYCDVIVARWEKFTGKKGMRDGKAKVRKKEATA